MDDRMASGSAQAPEQAGEDKAQVTVLIVNWNSGAMLKHCLECLASQSLQPARIIVIDNASTDDSLAHLHPHPAVMVLPQQNNLGFAAANNLGLKHCTTELVALLNPDAFPQPDWLAALVSAARRHPECAAFGSIQTCHPDTHRLDGTGDVYHLSGLIWRRDHGALRADTLTPAGDIFSPCAAAALYRRDAVQAVGGFDERFFCYAEDVDLGFRLRLAGQVCRVVPEAVVYHMGSATTGGQHSAFAVYHGHRNLVWTFVKNMPGPLFWLCLPLHLLMNLLTILVFAYRGQGRVILRAKTDALKGLPAIWRTRQQVQRNRQVSWHEIWAALDRRIWRRRFRVVWRP